MGLSIHYSGRFNNNNSLPEMIAEVKDIVKVFDWEYTVFEKDFPDGDYYDHEHNDDVYGIAFTPPECETVSITFLSNRRMSSAVNLMFYGKAESKPETDYLYMLSTKTQFAGIEVHKFVIHLFKHLKNKNYFAEINIKDEGEYWETDDEKVLEENFKRYGILLDSLCFAFENFPVKNNESFGDYFKRITEMVHKRLK